MDELRAKGFREKYRDQVFVFFFFCREGNRSDRGRARSRSKWRKCENKNANCLNSPLADSSLRVLRETYAFAVIRLFKINLHEPRLLKIIVCFSFLFYFYLMYPFENYESARSR